MSVGSVSDIQSQLLLDEILTKSKAQPVYLNEVTVVGGDSFSNGFYKVLLAPLLSKSDYTLSQLMESIEASRTALQKTDVFQSVNAVIRSKGNAILPKVPKYGNDDPISALVIINLQPIKLNSNAGFIRFNSQDYLSLDFNYVNNNCNKNAEMVDLGVSLTPYKPNNSMVSNAKFVSHLNNPSIRLLVDSFYANQENQEWLQSSEKSWGGIIGLLYKLPNANALTGVSFSERTIHDVQDTASDVVKKAVGDYTKLSIVNQLSYANIDYINNKTKNFPANGVTLDVNKEITFNRELYSSDHNKGNFAKVSGSLNLFKSFFNNAITAHGSVSAGSIWGNGPVHVSDRFYLGGYNSFRGFAKNAVNPEGGALFYSLGTTLYTKIPQIIKGTRTANNDLRFYVSSAVANISDNWVTSSSPDVVTFGLGIAYLNPWASLDLGYYISSRLDKYSESTIGIRDGFQFSVSIGGSILQWINSS
ncbi:uncharacterized protein KQ657_000150 [Scheffersomyces spartinae]|uniref:Bacterial surface antigen (D15) domain-containing protein n=1 Tax=Scheffersomyces spartinae TaxID=45513 RepID=A0A9P7VDH3_9ASCO|nr:uncharacterized protein KQ657_000150 [Scheffersomyces spartinae]KAG7196138.1 hypothetical protein KQ657_000150 [Scheffersomyces spartinae]